MHQGSHHFHKKRYPILSIVVLVWATVITGILLMVYQDVQKIKERSDSRYQYTSPEETGGTSTSNR